MINFWYWMNIIGCLVSEGRFGDLVRVENKKKQHWFGHTVLVGLGMHNLI